MRVNPLPSLSWRYLAVAMAFLVATFGSLLASAQESQDLSAITEEKTQLVRANCVAAQVTIQRLQNSDVVARTNRGRSYENVLKLMTAFNARVASNRLSEPKLIETTAAMERQTRAFYQHYDQYKDTIERITDLDCRDQPVTFYGDLQILRSQRETLRRDVEELDKFVAEYSRLVAELKDRLSPPVVPNEAEAAQ